MYEPEVGDFVIIGGTGAYCSSMSPFNYNSHIQAPEYMFGLKGDVRLVRRAQTLEQIIQNETDE
jgi:diaminopimelate decarboxylase